jgi:hypothetical protein
VQGFQDKTTQRSSAVVAHKDLELSLQKNGAPDLLVGDETIGGKGASTKFACHHEGIA